MTHVDRRCIKVALLPVALYVVGLFGFMLCRLMVGPSPLPVGWAPFVPAASIVVTSAAILTANLLRITMTSASGRS